nr:MAG TPA: hypothetical protein [Caudoviricetes sp.]
MNSDVEFWLKLVDCPLQSIINLFRLQNNHLLSVSLSVRRRSQERRKRHGTVTNCRK